LDKNITLYPDSRVKCIVDIPITFEESTYLKQNFTEKFKLREFILEESDEIQEALSETETTINWDENKLASVDDLVRQMLLDIESDHINNQQLINIYNELII
jgi:hypothetical protein